MRFDSTLRGSASTTRTPKRGSSPGRPSSLVKLVTFYLLTAFITLAGSLIAAELFCRVLYSPPYEFSLCGGGACFDARWGLYSCPGYEGCTAKKAILSKKEGAEYVETLNSFGCRGPEPVLPKPEGMFRVVFLGDSYVRAESVLLLETIAYQFTEKMGVSLPGMDIDAYNVGFSGFCTYQQTEWFLHSGKRMDPDLVFLVFTHNDITAYKQHMFSRVSSDHYYLPKGVEDMRKLAGLYLMQPFDWTLSILRT
jgi:hypothetical protein